MARKQVNFRLPQEKVEALQKQAEKEGKKLNSVLEQLVDDYLAGASNELAGEEVSAKKIEEKINDAIAPLIKRIEQLEASSKLANDSNQLESFSNGIDSNKLANAINKSEPEISQGDSNGQDFDSDSNKLASASSQDNLGNSSNASNKLATDSTNNAPTPTNTNSPANNNGGEDVQIEELEANEVDETPHSETPASSTYKSTENDSSESESAIAPEESQSSVDCYNWQPLEKIAEALGISKKSLSEAASKQRKGRENFRFRTKGLHLEVAGKGQKAKWRVVPE